MRFWTDDELGELCDRVLADCHPRQRDFVLDPHRRISALVGRGGGKTTGGRARLVRRLLTTPRARCLYIAKTRDHAERLMWGPLKDTFESLGFEAGIDIVYNETKLRAQLKFNGATLWLFGADDKREIDKLRGQPWHEVGIDEAASHVDEVLRSLLFRIIGPRLGDFGGCIWLIGTPGHVQTCFFADVTRPASEFHRPYSDRADEQYRDFEGWSSHAWTLKDGADSVVAMARLWAEALIEKKNNRWSDDHPIWLREYLGRWAADDTENVFQYRAFDENGAPRNQWSPERAGELKLAKLPSEFREWTHVVAMDLGHSDPFALNVFAISPHDKARRIYHRYCFEKRKMYAQSIAHLLIGDALDHEHPGGVIGAIGQWPDAMVADLAGNGAAIIDELTKVYGVRVVAAEKKHKISGIEVVNGDFGDARLFILAGSPLEKQLETLQWKLDDFGHLKEDKAQPNHSTDCLVYARNAIGKLVTAFPDDEPAVADVSRDPGTPRMRRDDRDNFGDMFENDPAFEEWFKD